MNATDYTTPAPVREETNARNEARRRAALEACGRANLRAAAWFALVSYLDGGALDGVVRLSHSDLAARIGMTPQALNQGVRALCNIGVLMRDGRGLRITPDPAGAFGNSETKKRYVSETRKQRNATFPTVLETEKRSVSESAPLSPPAPPSFPTGEREELSSAPLNPPQAIPDIPPASAGAAASADADGVVHGPPRSLADFADAVDRRRRATGSRCRLTGRFLLYGWCNDHNFRVAWGTLPLAAWESAFEAMLMDREPFKVYKPVACLVGLARRAQERMREAQGRGQMARAESRPEPALACDRIHVAPPDSPARRHEARLRAMETGGARHAV